MKIKEAIEILKKVIICDQNDYAMVELDTLEAEGIIALLKRGEKFEKMWEEDAKDWLGNDLDLEEWMNETKQKYFPNLICGNCVSYDSDTCFCSKHPEYGELVEQDTCDDWTEDQ